MARPVRFYGSKSLLSNFSITPIVIDGLEYITTEHYFQAMKFSSTDPDYAEEIRTSPTPAKAKSLGGSRNHPIDKDWNTKRDEVMRIALFSKAMQTPKFVQILLSTGSAPLIEAAPRDYYWGEGSKKTGKNMLGKLLMDLRSRLQTYQTSYYH